MNYGFIGFGNLAKAIYHGLKHKPDLYFAYHSKSNQHQEIQSFKNLEELIHFADVIWLCIKPQIADEVLNQLNRFDLSKKLLVSTLAGKKISFIETHLNSPVPILRIMPNLAITYGKSVTACCINKHFSQLTLEVQEHLATLGQCVELPEEQFDLFTALFGSGPAFLLQIMQAFRAESNRLNLPEAYKNLLLAQLLDGTASYFKENVPQKSLKHLIEAIASKGGTTEAGLDYFKDHKMGEWLQGMIQAAEQRGKEMG